MTSVGVTNFDTGEYTPFYLNNTQENDLNYILASAAPPIVFPPQNFEGSTWADGGCTVNIDIVTPINWCLD